MYCLTWSWNIEVGSGRGDDRLKLGYRAVWSTAPCLPQNQAQLDVKDTMWTFPALPSFHRG